VLIVLPVFRKVTAQNFTLSYCLCILCSKVHVPSLCCVDRFTETRHTAEWSVCRWCQH